MSAYLRLLRPKQWIKNGFVLGPLLLSFDLVVGPAVASALLATVAFCLLSSAIYVANDIHDLEADRAHPRKRHRPIAAGEIGERAAWGLFAGLLAACVGIGLLGGLAPGFWIVAAVYAASSLAYSLGLKRVALLELFLVASGYVYRVIAGSVAIQVPPSPWILAGVGALALLIVTGKRAGEASSRADALEHRTSLRSYPRGFLDVMAALLAGTTIVVYMLYCMSERAVERFDQPYLIATAVPVAFAVLRYLQHLFLSEEAEDPIELLLADKFLLGACSVWLAAIVGFKVL